MSISLKFKNILVSLQAAVLTAVCFLIVRQANDPTGGDGYFYLKQMEVLGNSLQFYHADYSFIFVPLVCLYKITGNSLLSYQLITCASYFLILYVLGCGFSMAFGRYSLSLTALGLVTVGIQPALLHLCFEFAKNGFAIAMLLFGMHLYRQKKVTVSILFFLIALLTHKIVVLFLGFMILTYTITKVKSKKSIVILGIGTLATLFVVYLVFPNLSYHLQNYYLNFKFEVQPFFMNESHLISNLNLLLIFIWLGLAVPFLKQESREIKTSLLIFSVLPFLPIFSGLNIEIKYRLFLVSFVLSTLLFIYVLRDFKSEFLKAGALIFSLMVLLFTGLSDNSFPWIALERHDSKYRPTERKSSRI